MACVTYRVQWPLQQPVGRVLPPHAPECRRVRSMPNAACNHDDTALAVEAPDRVICDLAAEWIAI